MLSVCCILYFMYHIFSALVQFKIEEITLKLRTGELGIPDDPADRFVTQHIVSWLLVKKRSLADDIYF